MPNPKEPSYGRLQIDTTNKVAPVEQQVSTDQGSRGRGGMKSGGFKFAQDSQGAYRAPESLIGAVLDNAQGVAASVNDAFALPNKWADEADKAAEDDLAVQLAEEQAKDDFITADEATRAARLQTITNSFDGQFIQDGAKNRQKIRGAQGRASVRQGEGVSVINSYATEFADLENMEGPEKIAMYEAMMKDADSILDPELRRQFQSSINTTHSSMMDDMQATHVGALKDFEKTLQTSFPSTAEIAEADYPSREAFVNGTVLTQKDVWSGMGEEQEAMGEVLFRSLAGDAWDRAQTATSRELGFEKTLIIRDTIGTAEGRQTVLPIISKLSVNRGITAMADGIARNPKRFNKPDQIRSAAEDFGQDLLSQNPARFQEFLLSVEPNGFNPEFDALRAAANGSEEDFIKHIQGSEWTGPALTQSVEMYANRVVAAIGTAETRNGQTANGKGAQPTAQESTNIVIQAERDAKREEISAASGGKIASEDVPESLISDGIVQASSTPNSGMMLRVDDNYDDTSIPKLTNAVYSLPPGSPERKQGFVQLDAMDNSVGMWMDALVEQEGGLEALQLMGLDKAKELWEHEKALAAAGGMEEGFAPGQLAALVAEIDPNLSGTYGLSKVLQGRIRGTTKFLNGSKFYSEDGVRQFTDHTEAKAMTADFVASGFDSPQAAKASPYAVAMRDTFGKVGGLFKDNGEGGFVFDRGAYEANPSLRYAVPTIAQNALVNGGSIGMTDLAITMVKSLMPPHVADIYDRGNLLVKNAVLTMSADFFANTQDLSSPSAQEYIDTFEARLGIMMTASSDPATQKRGLDKLNGAPVAVSGVITDAMVSQLFGRSTVNEAHSNNMAFTQVNPAAGRRTGVTKDADGKVVDYNPDNNEYRDDTYYVMLDKLHGEYQGEAIHGDEDAYRAQQEADQKALVDQTATAAIVRYAVENDPTFAATLMNSLSAFEGSPNKTIAGVIGQYAQDNNITVMQRPFPGGSGASEHSDGFGWASSLRWEMETEGAALGAVVSMSQADARNALQFDVVISPTDAGSGSISMVDGTSQYTTAQKTNDAEFRASWGGDDGFDEALGFTNTLSRRFLTPDQTTEVGDEVSARVSDALKIPKAVVDRALYEVLAGDDFTMMGIDEGADLFMGAHNLVNPMFDLAGTEEMRFKVARLNESGIAPGTSVEERSAYKQVSAERAALLLAYADSIRNGRSVAKDLPGVIAEIRSLVPTDMGEKNADGTPDVNSDTERMSMLQRKHGGSLIEVRQRDSVSKLSITDRGYLRMVDSWITSGRAIPQAVSANRTVRPLTKRDTTRSAPPVASRSMLMDPTTLGGRPDPVKPTPVTTPSGNIMDPGF